MTHAVPAALWCALAPAQLVAGRPGDAAHRQRGQYALAAAALAMIGFAIIDAGEQTLTLTLTLTLVNPILNIKP